MTEPQSPRENHREIAKSKISRRKIIDAALREFGQRGYEGASTNQICLSAGISKGLLYHYFKNKENLFLAVCDRCLDDLWQFLDLDKLRSHPVDDGALLDFYRRQTDFFSTHPDHYHILTQLLSSCPSDAVAGMIEDKRRVFRDRASVALRLFLSRSSLRPDVDKELTLQLLLELVESVQARYLELIFRRHVPAELALETMEKGLRASLDIILYGILQRENERKGEERCV